jgi:predicted transcriptional regulator
VSTVLNLDAAVWGTTGFVVSELKKNKQQHPSATMVLDADGEGVDTWALGEAGTGLIIMDKAGIVRYFSLGSPDENALATTLELIKTLSGS